MSLMIAAGFSKVELMDVYVVGGYKAAWQASGAPLKRKKVADTQQKAANPWASLQNTDAQVTKFYLSFRQLMKMN